MLYRVGVGERDSYLRPDQFLDHLAVIKRPNDYDTQCDLLAILTQKTTPEMCKKKT